MFQIRLSGIVVLLKIWLLDFIVQEFFLTYSQESSHLIDLFQ